MEASDRLALERLLRSYRAHPGEEGLYQAQKLARRFLEARSGPTELMAEFVRIMSGVAEPPEPWREAYPVLEEMMVQYGAALGRAQELARANRQLMEELDLAATLQQSLLPNLARLRKPAGVELGVVSAAARKVSGDFYNAYASEERLEFAVADVSGKSMPAAILMSMIKFAMDEIGEDASRPHLALEALNRFLLGHVDASMFVTMFWGEYEAATGWFYYSSAGHEPALHYRAAGGAIGELSTAGPALGLSDRLPFRTQRVRMRPGDCVLVYTDGVIERRHRKEADDAEHLKARLLELLADPAASASAQQLADGLYRRLQEDAPLERTLDDQTLLIFRMEE